jgi:hypothetical protein
MSLCASCERLPSHVGDLHANDLDRASPGDHAFDCRRCEPGEAQIGQQRDTKAVRHHQRFSQALRCVGEHTKRAATVTALALRTHSQWILTAATSPRTLVCSAAAEARGAPARLSYPLTMRRQITILLCAIPSGTEGEERWLTCLLGAGCC